MIENTRVLDIVTHVFVILCIVILCFPLYIVIATATHSLEEVNQFPIPLSLGGELFNNIRSAWQDADLGRQLFNTFVQASGIAIGKIVISMLSAYAIVFFRFPFRGLAFWLIFISLMMPVEVRIVPTYAAAANLAAPLLWVIKACGLEWLIHIKIKLSLLNSYWGLILPMIASATATFLLRQFFRTVPDELLEAAKIDGAGPMRFFFDILLPLSRTTIAAIAVIMFLDGWNQYLWPFLITTKSDYLTAVVGLTKLMPSPDTPPQWNITMAAALLIMLPPILMVGILQRLFVKGLISPEK